MANPVVPTIAVLISSMLFGCEAEDLAPEGQDQGGYSAEEPQGAYDDEDSDAQDASGEMDEGAPGYCDASCSVDEGKGDQLDPRDSGQIAPSQDDDPDDLPSCPYGGEVQAESPLSRQIQRACVTWEEGRLHQYSFVYEQSGVWGATRVLTIDVVGDTVLGAQDSDNRPVDPEGLPTINTVFYDLAELAELEPHRMQVRYDDQTGVPERVAVDLMGMVVDDEIFVRIDYLSGQEY